MKTGNHKKFNPTRLIILGLWLFIFAAGAYAQSYPCVNAIYFTSYSNTNVYRYTPSTNAITQVTGYSTANPSAAAALTPNGTRLYYADNSSRLRFNTGNNNNTSAASGLSSNAIQRNGIDLNGNGYFMVGGFASYEYYRYTTTGTTSAVTGPFTLLIQPSTAQAVGAGGDLAFDANGIGYMLDQASRLYRIDFTTNVANLIGTVSGISGSPNGLGFAQTNSGTYELYVSTLANTLFRINLTTNVATRVMPSSTVSGFTQNDIASCIYPPNIVPNVTAVKAWRNVTRGDAANFTVSTPANPGDTLEYRVVVRNTGAIGAGDTTFQDAIPSGLNYVAASTTLNGAAVTDNGGSGNARFAYGTARTIQGAGETANSGVLSVDTTANNITDDEAVVIFRVTVSSPFTGTANPVSNTAVVDYAGATSNVNSNTTTTPVLLPDLTIAKSHTGNFTRGSTGVYTLTITNAGSASTAGTITVTDNLPTGLSVNNGLAGPVTVSGPNAANWTCNSNAATPQTITCTGNIVISITTGSNTSSFNLTVNVSSTAAANVTNVASVSGGGEPTLNNGNNTASDPTVTIAGVPNLALVKSCTSPGNCPTASQLPETDLTYQIQFTNSGTSAASAVTIIDPIPQYTDFKVGSAQSNAPIGLTLLVEYSNDYTAGNPAAASWTYTPASSGGGAAAGYDRNVRAVRWRTTSGALSSVSPDNTGNVSFTVKIK